MIGIFNLNLDLMSLESFFEDLDTPDLVYVFFFKCNGIGNVLPIQDSCTRSCCLEDWRIFLMMK